MSDNQTGDNPMSKGQMSDNQINDTQNIRKNSRKKHPLLIAAILTGALAVILTFSALSLPHGDQILTGVSAAGVDLSGKTQAEAAALLQPLIDSKLTRTIAIEGESKTWTASSQELGLRTNGGQLAEKAWQVGHSGSFWQDFGQRWRAWRDGVEIALELQVDEAALNSYLVKIDEEVHVLPENATVVIATGFKPVIVPSKNGREVDKTKTAADLKSALLDESRSEVTLAMTVAKPEISTEQAEAWGINGVVARYSTAFNPANIERSDNIRIAAKALQDTLVMPGGVLSFNGTVGPRTIEAGYQEALIIQNNEFVPGLAGGICQMVSTLYNGLLLSGFSVVERHPHSLPVAYVPPGLDATVAGTALDLKMRNEFSTPVLLHTEYSRGKISVYIFGPLAEKPEIRLSGRKLKSIPADVIRILDKTLAPGKEVVEVSAVAGMEAEAHREFLKDGQVVKRELLSKNRYRSVTAKIRYNPAPPATEPVPTDASASAGTGGSGAVTVQ